MSQLLAPILPAAFARTVCADPNPDQGFTILVLSTTPDGWPHAAMISIGEIVTSGDQKVLLALWAKSTVTANLSASKRTTLLAVVDHTSYRVRLSVRRLPDFETPRSRTMACFEGVVDGAAADEAPYAVIECGVRFRLTDPDETLARWRETRSALHRIARES